MRSLPELIDRHDPALPLLREWAKAGETVVYPPDEASRETTLLSLQVTTRSLLGAVAYETGGVSAADGLIRILGSGESRSLASAARVSGLPLDGSGGALLVADDALGGLFAINGTAFGGSSPGRVFYLPADETSWTDLEIGYSDFVSWCLTGDSAALYANLVELDEYRARPRPAFDKTHSFYPFLWSTKRSAGKASVALVEGDEIVGLRLELHGLAVD